MIKCMGGVNDAVDQIDFRLNQYSTKFIQPSLIQNFLCTGRALIINKRNVDCSRRSGGGERVKSYAVSPKATRGEKRSILIFPRPFFGARALLSERLE